jgi:hypothetical protein
VEAHEQGGPGKWAHPPLTLTPAAIMHSRFSRAEPERHAYPGSR